MQPRLLLISFLFCCSQLCDLYAQNLVPNPDFEIYSPCPVINADPGPLECPPWIDGSMGTSDIFNACANPGSAGVPNNSFGYQPAYSGEGYAGIWVRSGPPNYREYLQAQLLTPLVAGQWYYFSMYANVCNERCGSNRLGAYFSAIPPVPSGFVINVVPQVAFQFGMITDTMEWTPVSMCFQAAGGEEYITIGNFYDDDNTTVDPSCTVAPNTSYFHIDDIVLEAATQPGTIDVDLGPDVVVCLSYVIDPQIGGVQYIWSNGTFGPTLTVTESGTYSLTVVSGCDIGEDEIEVEILGSDPPVDIGDDQVVICEGDSYTISLDPDAGDYNWSNGTSNPEITITTPGTYSVTLDDDGCDVSIDEIEVQLLLPPEPFSLGNDTTLCEGEELDIDFDPDLGDFLWSDNSTSPYYTITNDGLYSVTISNMCGMMFDDIIVATLMPPLSGNVPEDVYICSDEPVEIVLDPGLYSYLWDDGSTSSTYTITTPGIHGVTISNICGEVNEDILAIALEDPEVDIGTDLVLCSGDFPFMLDPEVLNSENYLWQDGSIDSVYEVITPGIYSVTVSNACNSVTDQITISEDASNPLPLLPPDQLLCPGQTFTLSNSGSTGISEWQNGSTADTFLVTTPGTYVLTIYTLCGSGSDTTIVSYVPPLQVPDLGPDITLCPGEQHILYATTGNAQSLWQDGSMADSFIVQQAGTYFVIISNQCNSLSDTITITVDNLPPQITLQDEALLCEGGTLNIDPGVSGVSYLWSDGTIADTLLVSSPGAYSLTVTNACGTDTDTILIVDGGPLPEVSLGMDISFCEGDTVTINPAFLDTDSWIWHDGSIDTSYESSAAEIISIQVENQCGIAYDTLIATQLPSTPSFDLGPDTMLCAPVELWLNISIQDVSILWGDGSMDTSLQVVAGGQYSAVIANACGSYADSIEVEVLPPVPVLDLGIDQSLCPGEVITIAPDIDSVTFVWQDGSTGSSFETTQAGIIILTISNACGIDADTVFIIESTEGPDVDLGPDVLACEGEVVMLSSNISGVDFLWQDGSTLPELNAATSGVYVLEVSNNCGMDADTVVVNIEGLPPAISLGPDTVLCEGDALMLFASNDTTTNIQWQDGSSALSYVVTLPGLYALMESNHCGFDHDSILIDFVPAPPVVDLGPDTVLCPGDFILLEVPLGNNFATQWQDGSNGNTMVADEAQTFSVILSNECGIQLDEINIAIDDHVPAQAIDDTISFCLGSTVLLNAAQLFPASYAWNTGDTSASVMVSDTGLYIVEIATNCIVVIDHAQVMEADTCLTHTYYVPNIFSPNGDGVNDIFSIFFKDEKIIDQIDAEIFDRWGNKVHESHEPTLEWDGSFRGMPMNPAVFAYRIEVRYKPPYRYRDVILHGDVTLIR